ncbi:MAG TPA: hypothetical protein VFK43_12420 [Acidimicrobiales bacterium]|nr:hypothetical protein [Acidimicrobiales bacterium]
MSVAVALAGCSGTSTPPVAGRLVVEGQAEVLHPGEDRREVSGSRNLEAGDRVRVRQGTAVIQLRDDRRFELRQGSDLELLPRETTNDIIPTLVAGDLLIVSDARRLVVSANGAEISVQGDARVSRGVALLVATYEGAAQLSAGGSTIAVPALRQASLPPTGTFPTKVAPLEYSSADGWDQRYLSDAMDLSNQLKGRSDGFTSQLGATEGRSVNSFRELFPRLAAEPAFTASLLNPARAPGDTLVGAAITLEGTRGTFAERWAAVFTFRDEGAEWGLVAMDQGVARVPLLNAIDAAISRGPTQFAVGPPGRPPTSLNPPITGGATSSVPATTTTTARPRPGVTTTTTTAPPAPGGTTNTSVTGPLNTGTPVDDAVNDLVNTLTGLLRSLGGQ